MAWRLHKKIDIERGILSSGEESARQKEIQIDRQNISLDVEFENYREKKLQENDIWILKKKFGRREWLQPGKN